MVSTSGSPARTGKSPRTRNIRRCGEALVPGPLYAVGYIQRVIAALSILFFCSGVSALIYQVLWIRLLGLTFGVTIYAAATVSASFMAGLAAGSAGAGWLADRVR